MSQSRGDHHTVTVFDRAELNDGQSLAIHSVIESIEPGEDELEAASMANEDPFSGPVGSGMAGGGLIGGDVGGGRAGGGLLRGGAAEVGGATSAVANVGGVGSDVSSSAGGSLNAGGDALKEAGNLTGSAAGHAGRGIYGSAGAVNLLGMHATAIPGAMLKSKTIGGVSGTFIAAQKVCSSRQRNEDGVAGDGRSPIAN